MTTRRLGGGYQEHPQEQSTEDEKLAEELAKAAENPVALFSSI